MAKKTSRRKRRTGHKGKLTKRQQHAKVFRRHHVKRKSKLARGHKHTRGPTAPKQGRRRSVAHHAGQTSVSMPSTPRAKARAQRQHKDRVEAQHHKHLSHSAAVHAHKEATKGHSKAKRARRTHAMRLKRHIIKRHGS